MPRVGERPGTMKLRLLMKYWFQLPKNYKTEFRLPMPTMRLRIVLALLQKIVDLRQKHLNRMLARHPFVSNIMAFFIHKRLI